MPTFHNTRDPAGSAQYRANPAQSGDKPTDEALIAIGPLLNTLWQRKGLIVFITALFVGLAFLYVSVIPKTYTANGVIVIDPQQVQVLASESAISGIGANSAAIASQVEIIQSRTLVQKVFLEQGFVADPEFAKTRMLSVLFGLFSPPQPATQAQIFNNFWNRLGVERQGLTYVINISFSSLNAQKSAEIVNAIIAAYMGSQVDEKSAANAQVSVLLSAQMEGLRDELSQREAAVEAFKEAHDILSVGAGGTLLQSQIEQLSTQLVVARELARATNNRHQQIATINANSDPLSTLFELLLDTGSGSLRASYTQSSLELSSLQASLGSRHPNLQVAAAELNRLENLIRSEAQSMLTQIANEKDLARTNADNAELELEALRAQNSVSNQNQVRLRDLERHAQATRQVLEQLISREKETGQLENLQRSNARVISEAVAPISAKWPKSTLILAVSAFLGVALASSIALYLVPKAPNETARNQRLRAAKNNAETRREYAPSDNYHAPYQDRFEHDDDAPIYHSSELKHAMAAPRHQSVGEEIENLSEASEVYSAKNSNLAGTQQKMPSNLWARRAAGTAYAPSAKTNSRTIFSSNFTASRNAHRTISPHNKVTREGFVTELKRRLEKNAPR